ncbi:AIM24 family protein [soil metagenome]
MTGPGAGSWQPDPDGRYEYRWWDGQSWTDQVSNQGQVGRAPLAGAVAPQATAGPQASVHVPPQETSPLGPVAQGDGFSGITGDLVDGRFSEKEAKPIANQNAKLLRVRLGEPFMARQGSMVAYQGNVDFAFEGGGASKFLKKAFTGEGLPLMRCQGQGDVFLAEQAHDVHLLNLNNSGLSISGKNVLAFSSSLDWNIERVKGGSMATGGLFNTTLRGTGWVALTTDGPPVVLNAAEAPTFADTNAVVAWSANLQTQLKTSFTAGALIGRGSGEALQVGFHGQGFVIVQPSEGIQIPTQ